MGFIAQKGLADAGAGPIDEVRGVIANFADGLGAFDQMYDRMAHNGRLAQSLRYVILGSSARWRSDDYIASVMYRQALGEGLTAVELGALIDEAEGDEPSTPDAALLAFCRKVTETAFKMVQRDVDALSDHGWSNGEIVEAITMVSLSGYMTTMAASGGLLHSDGLEAEPWR